MLRTCSTVTASLSDQANEAVNDEGAIWYDPDPASKSGAVGSRRRVIAVAPGDRHRDLATRR